MIEPKPHQEMPEPTQSGGAYLIDRTERIGAHTKRIIILLFAWGSRGLLLCVMPYGHVCVDTEKEFKKIQIYVVACV